MAYEDYAVRPFDPVRDLDAVFRCYESGFGPGLRPLFEYSDRAAIEDMVMTDYRASSVALVAEAGGEARGLLFGTLSSRPLAGARFLLLEAAFMLRRMVWRRNEMRPLARAVLWHSYSRELFYFFLHSPGGKAAELEALSSQEGWRGGIGRALTDAFVEQARSAGFHRVDVYTDSELSWGFYERYGFRRVAEWTSHAYDFSLPDRDVTAYLYSLDI